MRDILGSWKYKLSGRGYTPSTAMAFDPHRHAQRTQRHTHVRSCLKCIWRIEYVFVLLTEYDDRRGGVKYNICSIDVPRNVDTGDD